VIIKGVNNDGENYTESSIQARTAALGKSGQGESARVN